MTKLPLATETPTHAPLPALAPQINPGERFEHVEMEGIEEHPGNPRRTFDPAKLLELSKSIATKGVLQPGILRPHPKPKGLIRYQLIAGARRFRASKLAARHFYPAIIRELDDEAVEEIQIIENHDREGVHPLEQADGYAKLMLRPNYTPQIIADKIGGGHTAEFVTKRIQLTKLTKKLREDFLENKIILGHALAICRLPDDKQEFCRQHGLYERQRGQHTANGWKDGELEAVSVARLELFIKTEVFLDLSSAPWKKDDIELIVKAGACTVCTKRTGANAVLFDELKKGDNCLDSKCFHEKAAAHLIQITRGFEEKGEKVKRISSKYHDAPKDALTQSHFTLCEGKTKKCEKAIRGVWIDGPRMGQAPLICTDSTCKTHHPYGTQHGGSNGKEDFWTVRAKKLEGNITIAWRKEVVKAIIAKPHDWTVPHEQLAIVARTLLIRGDVTAELINAMDLPGTTPGSVMKVHTADGNYLDKYVNAPKGSPFAIALPRIVTGLSLAAFLKDYCYLDEKDVLIPAAKAFGVDAAKMKIELGTSMRTEFNAKRDKAKAKKALAEKAAKKKKGKVELPAGKAKKTAKAKAKAAGK